MPGFRATDTLALSLIVLCLGDCLLGGRGIVATSAKLESPRLRCGRLTDVRRDKTTAVRLCCLANAMLSPSDDSCAVERRNDFDG